MRGKVVVVTGGSSGIGKEVARSCVLKGAHVVILARRLEVLKAVHEELLALAQPQGTQVKYYSVDVTDAAATAAALEAAAKECGGGIHCVVCSAGTSSPREFLQQTAKEFEDLVRLNLMGTRNAVAAALPFMRDKAGGRVVFISSQAGQVGLYGYTAYSVRKFRGGARRDGHPHHPCALVCAPIFPASAALQ